MSAILSRRPARLAIGLVAPVLLLAWWQYQATAGDSRSLAFAPLGSVGTAFVGMAASGALLFDIAATLTRSLFGLVVGGGVGIAVGVLTGLSRPLDRIVGPFLHAVRQVPLMGWLPLLGLWFGAAEGSQAIVVCLSAFFPAMLNTHAGVANVERRFLDVGRIYGFTPMQRFRRILLPAAMPMILTGLTQALAFTWIAEIGTEILLGTGGGLGVTLQNAQMQQRMDVILVTILVTAMIGLAVNQLFLALRRHLLRWQAAPL
ncbi:ABC transporter permease [Sphingomonas profundi]|uniref:ABC transporter permease n=1 Tax=Alterirhizorhabdus profundi TaxID=2681549 RepID=UPI001E40C407|nr:ABC transporter permease subunit [Sphingomonas profundi]